ncbi:MAG: hypothetical protein PV340_00030 [Wolbachia sp.]|nr:hypothetical protein [Wolbachia sp.]
MGVVVAEISAELGAATAAKAAENSIPIYEEKVKKIDWMVEKLMI